MIILVSWLLHVIGLLLICWHPACWSVIVGVLLFNHVLLTFLGLWPRSTWLGPNMVRMRAGSRNCVYLTFDDGPNPEITPEVLNILEQYHCSCTFFLVGRHVRQYPDLVKEIVRRGHAIGNHSHDHGYTFAMHSVRGYIEELEAAQKAIFDVAGVWPRYFRAPFGFRSPLLEPALCKTGLHLMSWTRRGFDTRCKSPRKVLERLIRNVAEGDILLLHDGPFAHERGEGPMVLRVLPELLEGLKTRGLHSAALPDA